MARAHGLAPLQVHLGRLTLALTQQTRLKGGMAAQLSCSERVVCFNRFKVVHCTCGVQHMSDRNAFLSQFLPAILSRKRLIQGITHCCWVILAWHPEFELLAAINIYLYAK